MTRSSICLGCLLAFSALPAIGQRAGGERTETGLPFLECSRATITGGANQIWSILQDERDLIYAVSTNGAGEFDGAAWRHYTTDGYSSVRSLDHDGKGRIYLAGVGEFGYLAPDSVGRRAYRGLESFVPDEHRDFTDIWTVHVSENGVYFLAREKLFLASESDGTWNIEVWTPEERFLYGFMHEDTYYVHQQGVGLTRMDGDQLVPVAGGDQFGGERMQVMLPHPDYAEGFILGTFNRGLFRYDGETFSPWVTDVDAYLRDNTLYKGTVLADGSYALATLSGGVVLVSRSGSARGILNINSGLPGNDVLSLLTDRDGLLWAAPQGWICQIDVSSPLTRFDASLGLDGDLTYILRHEGLLYITTQNSVQYLDSASGRLVNVRGFAQGVSQAWQLLSVDEDLFVATGTGLYLIRGDRAEPIVENEAGVGYSPTSLHRSLQDPNRVLVGVLDGLASVYRDAPGVWRDEGRIDGVSSDVREIIEPSPGLFWLSTTTTGAVRLRLSSDRSVVGEVESFAQESGLKSATALTLRHFDETVIASDVDRVVRFDESSQSFRVDSLLSSVVHGFPQGGGDMKQGDRGIWYLSFGFETAMLVPNEDGSVTMDRTPFRRFADAGVRAIYPDDDGIVWFGTDDDLIRYDPSVARSYDAQFPVLLRRVTSTHGRVVYAGETVDEAAVRLPPSEDNLQFEYAAAVYHKPSATTFQTILDGFDEEWSEWKADTRREYTNIPPGNYTFRVRGRNVYAKEGTEASFAFSILPPWYRSLWAYAIYGLLFVGGVAATDRFQRHRLMKKERERSAVEQAELRAVAAEAQNKALEAQSKALEVENERKKNIELLSRIGRDITSTLSVEQIIDTVYEHVNAMMDASVFGIGLYNAAENRLEFPATQEKGKRLPFFVNSLEDKNRIAVWCFKHQEEVVIQNLAEEWTRYLEHFVPAVAGDDAASILYLPLVHHDKPIGVITAQSFEKDAYTENHLNILRNLATYTAIALDNAEAYRRLNSTVDDLNEALDDLKTTQEQLVTQEKMASLGALTAGIAHEVKNPLNFVNNFAQLIVELADELRDELTKNRNRHVSDVLDDLDEIVSGLKANARQIAKHGKRADDIVRGMMEHASGGSGERFEVAVNGFVEEYLQLAYHGMRARPGAIEIDTVKEFAPNAGNVSMVPQDIARVIVNLLNNAFDAVREHAGKVNGQFEPRVIIRTRRNGSRVEIEVEDNGGGVPDHVREKIFEPFFTTKPTGSGTGLGLSLSYDIVVRSHGGSLTVENVPGGGARFSVSLPA